MPAVVIRDGRIVLPEGIIRGELSIENGKIGTIALTGIPRGDVEIRARGGLVIPGAIDGHTHFYSRKYIYRENFRTGSIAAAAGGVTTVAVSLLDDPIKTPKKAREVIEFGEKNSMVDFMLHAGNLTPGSIKNMVKLASIGIRSFKVSNCYPNPCSYEGMGRMMELATKLDSLMIAYPEDVVALREVRRKLIREGKRDILAYMQGHPAEAEERGIEKIAEMALRSNCPVHFAPVTTESGSKVVSSYKKKRSRVTAETCPHYLVFSAEDFKRMGPWIKVSPPIRSPGDVAALWSAIEDGTIDMVTSGHAPTTKAEKMGKISVWGSPSGIPSLETLIPVLFTEGVARGRMSVEKMVSLLSS
ncbi:MAG: dihydroorotase family protein, partial [Candidatus Hadarchaeales archaeon]